jgi:hypothetical protein
MLTRGGIAAVDRQAQRLWVLDPDTLEVLNERQLADPEDRRSASSRFDALVTSPGSETAVVYGVLGPENGMGMFVVDVSTGRRGRVVTPQIAAREHPDRTQLGSRHFASRVHQCVESSMSPDGRYFYCVAGFNDGVHRFRVEGLELSYDAVSRPAGRTGIDQSSDGRFVAFSAEAPHGEVAPLDVYDAEDLGSPIGSIDMPSERWPIEFLGRGPNLITLSRPGFDSQAPREALVELTATGRPVAAYTLGSTLARADALLPSPDGTLIATWGVSGPVTVLDVPRR